MIQEATEFKLQMAVLHAVAEDREYQEDPAEYEETLPPDPIDPPDNESLPGEPSTTEPDY